MLCEDVYSAAYEHSSFSPRMVEKLAIEPSWLKDELEKPGRSQSALARFLGLASPAIVNRMCKGDRKITAEEADGIRSYLAATARGEAASAVTMDRAPDLPLVEPLSDYEEIEVLPTFAGMGGGGTGDADRETALVPRRLVREELRAKPSDVILINVRGNSMEPVFFHGDQLLIDRRDRSPRQPGPFALLYDDGYVVKNVSWIDQNKRLRVSSSNPDFPPEELDPGEVSILGRPVWFARRL